MHASDSELPAASAPSLVLLGAASGISPFGMAIMVPVLASVANHFHTDLGAVQYLISAYLFGLALAQPVHGFACDRFGRRPVMLSGLALFVLASLAGIFATSLNQLIVLRCLQAVGVSVGTVASRAVVRDTRSAAGSAEALSYIAAATGLAPIVAPILGGWLGEYSGYQSVFAATGLMGLLVLGWMMVSLPETRNPATAHPRWADWWKNYALLLRCPAFIGYSLVFGFVQGSFFSFLAVGAAVFQADFGIGPRNFGIIWGTMAVSYVIGAMAGGRFTRSLGTRRVMRIGVLVTVIGGSLLVLTMSFGEITLAKMLSPMLAMMMAAGSVTPGALAGAVNAHPHMAGTASGLSSAIGLVVGGMFTIIAGELYRGDFMVIAWLIAAATVLTSVSLLLAQRARQT